MTFTGNLMTLPIELNVAAWITLILMLLNFVSFVGVTVHLAGFDVGRSATANFVLSNSFGKLVTIILAYAFVTLMWYMSNLTIGWLLIIVCLEAIYFVSLRCSAKQALEATKRLNAASR